MKIGLKSVEFLFLRLDFFFCILLVDDGFTDVD